MFWPECLPPPAIVERAHAQSQFDWKQCKGQSIEVNYQLSQRGDVAKARLASFQEMTGIKVGFEQIPEQQQRPKVAMEMSTGHPSFDVVNVGMHVLKRAAGSKRPYRPTRPRPYSMLHAVTASASIWATRKSRTRQTRPVWCANAAMATIWDDELITADCDLDMCTLRRTTIFAFDKHRWPEGYGRITEQTGAVEPPVWREPPATS